VLDTTADVGVGVTVLGPIRVIVDGRVLSVPRAQTRGILALLALQPGRPLSHEAIVEAMWAGAAPSRARAQVHSALSVIRGQLAKAGQAEVVESTRFGYRLALGPMDVDIGQFDSLTADAEREGDPSRAANLWRQALGLFHGEPLADAAGGYVAASRAGIDERRLLAIEKLADVELRLGKHANVAAELAPMLTAYPYRERLRGRVMLALHGSGRQAEALSLYHAYRRELSEKDGLDPGQELAELAVQILRAPADQTAPGPDGSGPGSSTVDTPRLLPVDVRGFAGRRRELDRLDLILADRGDRHTAADVVVVSGMGGVGKTALAVHWAHRVGDRFPDGQLYVNLRGFDPAGPAMPSGEAIRQFLAALAVPSQRIPADPDARINLYRTVLAGRRMLVVLDNARDAEQVRPLLPGAPGCLVLITSRTMLTSLVAAEGAHTIQLDPLSPEEAHDLLTRRLGKGRVRADSGTINQIIDCCARLPLALAIVAANAGTHPHLPLSSIAGQLGNSRERLDALSTGDTPATDVRAVFSWSYRTLSDGSARLFRLLGLHRGPAISITAAASLAATPVGQITAMLKELANAHLINEGTPGRYTIHDLLHAYAEDLARTAESHQRRHAAGQRMLDHYTHSAYGGDRLLNPHREPITPTPARPGVTAEHHADHEQALAWFTAEHPALLAAVDHATATGADTHAWQLAWALFHYLDGQGHWLDQIAVQQTAAAAAERLADLPARILTYRFLARANIQLSRFDDAHAHLRHALDLAGRIGDLVSQANVHNSLGHLWERQGNHSESLEHAQRALDLFRAIGDRHGQANTLNAVGWCHAMLGNHQQALANCEQSLDLCREIEDGYGQSHALDSLGYINHRLGRPDQAIVFYQQALDLARDLGARSRQVDYLTHLGDAHLDAGNPDDARNAWQQALMMLDEFHHPGAGQVRSKLAALSSG
jgi:DNA-binding SARP family transcriptional activator/tetratricopeptide (TPR) repeat protein